jgi:hypothetical protein
MRCHQGLNIVDQREFRPNQLRQGRVSGIRTGNPQTSGLLGNGSNPDPGSVRVRGLVPAVPDPAPYPCSPQS